MRRRIVLLGALAALGLGGWNDAPPPWEVVREASTIEMSVRAFGGSHRGRFDDWRGDIAFDPQAPAHRVLPPHKTAILLPAQKP